MFSIGITAASHFPFATDSNTSWKVGKGTVFYFRPGHETFPVYKQEHPLKIVANAGGLNPRGLAAGQIPQGAALIAVADAWDSMVSDRVYSPRRAIDDALAECRSLVGRQFTAPAVGALESLYEHGDLAMAAVRMHRPTPEPARALQIPPAMAMMERSLTVRNGHRAL